MANSTTIRLPDDLHRWARKRAIDEGISLNGYLISLLQQEREIADRLEHDRAYEKGMAKVEAAAARKGGE